MGEIMVLMVVGLPALGALLQIFWAQGESNEKFVWGLGVFLSCISGVAGLLNALGYFGGVLGEQVKILSWLGSYGVHYRLGVDGWNASFVFAGSLLFPLTAILVSKEPFARRGLIGLILGAQASFLGLVLSQDILLMFLFWVGLGLFGFFMISLWGGEDREKAANTYFKSGAIGNAILFAVILIVYFLAEAKTSNIHDLLEPVRSRDHIIEWAGVAVSSRYLVFLALLVSLAFRFPLWPIHGLWRRVTEQASAEALIVSKAITFLGSCFLLIRLGMGLFPEFFLDSKILFGTVGFLSLLFAFLLAYRAASIREMFTYSSMSIMGFVFLSLSSGSAVGVNGAIVISVFGSISLALLLYVMRAVEIRLSDCLYTNEDGSIRTRGLGRQAPGLALAGGMAVSALSLMPGTGAFPGLTLMMSGLYESTRGLFYFGMVALFWTGLVSFRMFRALFLGNPESQKPKVVDLTFEERFFMVPVVLVLIVLGLFPKPFTEAARPVIEQAILRSSGGSAGE